MMVDLPWLRSNALPPVVIIGSGPAGMTIALALEKKGISSLLLEAGDRNFSEESQDFYRGEVVGDPYFRLEDARLRMLGGTSNHWGGWCRPLEPHDFMTRADIPHTGWPIGFDDLAPYSAETEEILEVSGFTREAMGDGIEQISIATGRNVSFRQKYGRPIHDSQRILLALQTAVERIEAEENAVKALLLRGPDGERLRIEPSLVVLACGGIENSRLLLWSNAEDASPVVKNAATLGRYWMEHPTFEVAQAVLDDAMTARFGDNYMIFFQPSAESMRRYHSLNANIRVARRSANAVQAAACAVGDLSSALPEDMTRRVSCHHTVGMSWEQAPHPDNRVALGSERDAFGVPRPVLHWRKHDIDLRTARVAIELLGAHLVDTAEGAVRPNAFVLGEEDYPLDDELAGYHHIGGTRMASSPDQGIVDRDLKVFGMENLYVGGSSVFPTAGHANPTFTIVQLSLRLADHLADRNAAA